LAFLRGFLYSVFPIASVVNTRRDAAASDCESHLKSKKQKKKAASAKSHVVNTHLRKTQQCIIHSNSFQKQKKYTKYKKKSLYSFVVGCWESSFFFKHMDSAASVIV
jgi:hypothetical protein